MAQEKYAYMVEGARKGGEEMRTAIIGNGLEVDDMRLDDGYASRHLAFINFLIIHQSEISTSYE